MDIKNILKNKSQYRKKYISALFILTILIVVYFLHILYEIQQLRDFTTAIDMAGQQRTNVIRMTLNAGGYAFAESEDSKQKILKFLTRYINEFETDFAHLTGKDSKMFSKNITDIINKYYLENDGEQLENLNNYLDIMKGIRDRESDVDLYTNNELINILSRINEGSINVVDKPVKLLGIELANKIKKLSIIDTVYLSLFLIALASTIVLIFYPMEKSILSQEDKLRAKIKELFRKQEYAADSIARYKTIVDTAPVGIFVYDANKNKFKDSNKKLLQLLKLQPSEILIKNFLSVSASEQTNGTSGELNKKYINEVKQDKELTIEWTYKDKDGKDFPCEVHLSRLPSKDGFYIQGYVTDITERKSMEYKLIKVNNELMLANMAKINFLSTMSHELRTPLNSIIGFANVLKDKEVGPLNLEQEEYCIEIENNGQQLLTIINDILDIAKIDSGTIDIKPSSVNLKLLLEGCVKKIQGFSNAKTKKFSLVYGPGIDNVLLDNLRIEQVVMNLLSNAIKFTGDNGKISMNVNIEDNKIFIKVQDNGVGIPESKISTIFRAFEQADNSLTRKYNGTGLGLAIVKRIISLHKGDISVISKENEGTCFTIKLPYVKAEDNLDQKNIA